ncbi:MAG TPA: NAD(P)H-binding protein [Terriglobales bacterium]
MNEGRLNVVTGAFGFSGRRIAELLLASGGRVRTLTNHPDPAATTREGIEIAPLDFGNPEQLVESLTGARALYNTYWVRFPHGTSDHEIAVRNTITLLNAARKAGVERIVHVSITNPSLDSPLTYFRGKAELEAAIRASGLSYAILRPAVLFGPGDVLLNNIAWFLRRFPLFAIPGDGEYSLQPIFVGDLAALAIGMGGRTDSCIVDAVGPETYTYEELVRLIQRTVRSAAGIVHLPAGIVHVASLLLGRIVGDVVLTKEEITGLMDNLLVSSQRPLGRTSLRQWLTENAQSVGLRYASELKRHY